MFFFAKIGPNDRPMRVPFVICLWMILIVTIEGRTDDSVSDAFDSTQREADDDVLRTSYSEFLATFETYVREYLESNAGDVSADEAAAISRYLEDALRSLDDKMQRDLEEILDFLEFVTAATITRRIQQERVTPETAPMYSALI
eukprot:Selendium_serpulae@DN9348_c0_g1_i1.p2